MLMQRNTDQNKDKMNTLSKGDLMAKRNNPLNQTPNPLITVVDGARKEETEDAKIRKINAAKRKLKARKMAKASKPVRKKKKKKKK